jgi:hypothetical protein
MCILLSWMGCSQSHQPPGVHPIPASTAGLVRNPAPEAGILSDPDRIRFRFTNLTDGPARQTQAYITIVGRDASGRFCHLDPDGRFLPCSPDDNKVPKNGRTWCAYAIPFQDSPLDIHRTLRMDSARAYISVGEPIWLRVDESTGGLVQPNPANPSDPNGQVIFDWVEFALDDSGFHGNTTCVDQFGLPVTLAVIDRNHPNRLEGPVGLPETRSELFRAWRATMTAPFQGLEDPRGRRILAPAHDAAPGGLRDYFQGYLASMWDKFSREPLVLTPEDGTFTGRVEASGRLVFTRAGDPVPYVIAAMPTTSEVFLCSGVLAQGNDVEKVLGAQLAALLNRHLLEEPLAWKTAGDYYRRTPCNQYARFWHEHSLKRLAYGFPYDDVNDQSPSLATGDPMEIKVTFRWD